MAKTKKIFFVLAAFSVLALVGAGCGGGGTNTPGGTEPVNTNQTQGQTQTGGDLAAILGASKGITNYSYDQTIVNGNETFTSTDYRKDQKMRQDTTVAGQTTVSYIDLQSGDMYMYTPSTKQAIKFSAGTSETQNSKPIDQVTSKIDPSTQILGSETVNGEDCVVVQVTVDNNSEKIWLSKKYGLPMKMEMQTPTGPITTEIMNLKVGSVTDADVTLPAGAKIVTLPNLPSIPNAGQ